MIERHVFWFYFHTFAVNESISLSLPQNFTFFFISGLSGGKCGKVECLAIRALNPATVTVDNFSQQLKTHLFGLAFCELPRQLAGLGPCPRFA
jgi:hypothetical protein